MSSPTPFAKRIAELDELELYLASPARSSEAQVTAQARIVQLESENARTYARLRSRILARHYTEAGLRRVFGTRGSFEAQPSAAEQSYDHRDALLGGLLSASDLAAEELARDPHLVFYQPTPARVITALLEHAQLGRADTLFDLGSGLGHVLVLARLLFGARARGVEREPAYCEHARRSVRALALSEIEITCGDARSADLAEGNVFFMYTPFRGAALRQMLDRLEQLARVRPIRVCCYGPCAAEVAREPWLTPRAAAVRAPEQCVLESVVWPRPVTE